MLFVLIFLTISPQASYSEDCKSIFSDNTKEEDKTGLDNTIESLGLPYRFIRILKENDITSVADLATRKEGDLLKIPGFGVYVIGKIKTALAERGLNLKKEDRTGLDNTIESLGLSYRFIRILKESGITSVNHLTEMTEGDFLKIPGFGIYVIGKIKAGLNKRGLRLKEEEKPGLEHIESLGLSLKQIQILNENNITSVGDLIEKMTERKLLNIEGIGTGTLNEIKAGLEKRGLSLKEEEKPVLENEPESLTPFPTKIQKPKATGITEGLGKRGLSLKEEEKPVLENELESLGLSSKKIQTLNENGITSVDHFKIWTEEELLELPGFGVYTLDKIKAGLDKRGLRLKSNDPIESWDFLSWEIIDALNKEGIYFIDDLTEMTKKELLNIPGVEEHIFDEIKARLNERGLSLKEEENPV